MYGLQEYLVKFKIRKKRKEKKRKRKEKKKKRKDIKIIKKNKDKTYQYRQGDEMGLSSSWRSPHQLQGRHAVMEDTFEDGKLGGSHPESFISFCEFIGYLQCRIDKCLAEGRTRLRLVVFRRSACEKILLFKKSLCLTFIRRYPAFGIFKETKAEGNVSLLYDFIHLLDVLEFPHIGEGIRIAFLHEKLQPFAMCLLVC